MPNRRLLDAMLRRFTPTACRIAELGKTTERTVTDKALRDKLGA